MASSADRPAHGFRPPALGPGAVYFPAAAHLFREHPSLIRAIEVEPQPLWVKPRERPPHGSALQLATLQALRQPFLIHGIGAPLGGLNGEDPYQLPEFNWWAKLLDVRWTSEHLSLLDLDHDGEARNAGFLLPPLQSDEYVRLAAANIRKRAADTGLPVAFETGVNYFAPRGGELPDGTFWAQVAGAADCGILLDLTNLWVNAQNGRARIGDVLAALPLDRVWEVHVAGAEFRDGFWLDAHSGEIVPEVCDIARDIIPHLPNLAAVIFEAAPDRIKVLGDLGFMHQVEIVNGLWEARRLGEAVRNPRIEPHRRAVTHDARTWEAALAEALIDRQRPPEPLTREEDLRSLALYATLIAAFRRGVIADLLENTTRLILIGLGEVQTALWLDRYMSDVPPSFFASEEARNFAEWAQAQPPDIPGFRDILAFETAMVEAIAEGHSVDVPLSVDIETLVASIQKGVIPDTRAMARPTRLEITMGAQPRVTEIAA